MARAIWSGAISFGLVNVPVKLLSAVQDKDVHMHLLSKDGHCRLRQKLYCPDTGEEISRGDAVHGYEIAPDQYVIFEPDELKNLAPEASRSIDIKAFIKLEEIDPLYYERPYYLTPDEQGARAYRLLVEAMTTSGRVGIAQFVMRQKEYLAAIRPLNGVLCLETMRHADELTHPQEIEQPDVTVDKDQLKIAKQLIDALSKDFEPEQYEDQYRQRLLEAIERKAEGQEVVVQESPAQPQRVINLMDALEKSLNQIKKQEKPKRPRRKSA